MNDKRRTADELDDPQFAFCEPRYAAGRPTWHIRRLGDKGLCFGGGADTDALCGREVAWDAKPEVIDALVFDDGTCEECANKWREAVGYDE